MLASPIRLATTSRVLSHYPCDLFLLGRASIKPVTAKIQNPPAFVVKACLADCSDTGVLWEPIRNRPDPRASSDGYTATVSPGIFVRAPDDSPAGRYARMRGSPIATLKMARENSGGVESLDVVSLATGGLGDGNAFGCRSEAHEK
jgi:hypothetical protein